jgi:hypothetical protein
MCKYFLDPMSPASYVLGQLAEAGGSLRMTKLAVDPGVK